MIFLFHDSSSFDSSWKASGNIDPWTRQSCVMFCHIDAEWSLDFMFIRTLSHTIEVEKTYGRILHNYQLSGYKNHILEGNGIYIYFFYV